MGRTFQDQMSCDTISLLLPLYLDGILRMKEHEKVRSHLLQCLPCKRLTLVEQNPLQGLPRIPPELMEQFAADFDASLAEALRDPALRRMPPGGTPGWETRKRSPRGPLAPSFWDIHRTTLTWLSGLIVGAATSWAAVMWWKGPSSDSELDVLRVSDAPQQYLSLTSGTIQSTKDKAVPFPAASSPITVQVSSTTQRRHSVALPLAPPGQHDHIYLHDISGGFSPHRLDAALPWMESGSIPLSLESEFIPSSALNAEHLLYLHFSSGQLY